MKRALDHIHLRFAHSSRRHLFNKSAGVPRSVLKFAANQCMSGFLELGSRGALDSFKTTFHFFMVPKCTWSDIPPVTKSTPYHARDFLI